MTRANATSRVQPRWLCPRVLAKYCIPSLLGVRRCRQGWDSDIQATPQIPCGNGAIGYPLARMPMHGHWRWQPLVAIGTLHGLANAQIVHRKDVEPAQGKNEKHLRSPAPNTFYTHQLVYHFGIAVHRKHSELQGTILDLRGEIFQIGNFLAGEANAPQSVVRSTEQRFRGQGSRGIEPQEAHHNGPGSLAAELLIDNGPAQHH